MAGNNREVLNEQRSHWEQTYNDNCDMFGLVPSYSAIKAVELFKSEGVKNILELGGGQGRDTIFFAQNGFNVYVLEYSDKGIQAIKDKAQSLGLSQFITAIQHDAREKLPFDNQVFDACYSHMFFCMALTTSELKGVSSEILRVLKPKGITIYTARNTNDAHYGKGIHRGEDMYEVNGFIVHFFSKEKVEYLAHNSEKVSVEEFEEGELPRKLYYVVLKRA